MVDWEKYEKIPFAEKGRSLDGVDCWGLLQIIYREELGIELPSYLECYNETSERQKLSELVEEQATNYWRDVDDPKEFDVIIMKIHGFESHLGLVVRKGVMIHCEEGVGVSIVRYDGMRWKQRVRRFVRHAKC